jgi:hypothetical protein
MKAHPETRGLLENPEKVIQGGDFMKSPILLLILFFSFILSACGSDCGDVSAPPDATIEIQPPSVTYNGLSGDTCHPFTITVKNKDGIGMSCVKVYVSGSMAAPRDPARYYFYKNSECSGQYVNSSFSITTDNGAAFISIWIPAQVNGTSNTFKDTIEVRSGTLYTSASVEVQ